MSFFYSDDPVRDFDRWDAEQNAWLESRPKCAHCHEHIQDERLLNIHGELYHLECADEAFGERTEEHTNH